MIDSRDIKELHPTLQRGATELLRRCAEKGLVIKISSTYRDNEKQNALYAQGRTTKGDIVTNAKGGQSIHNYRLAFDVFQDINGKAYWTASVLTTVGTIWKEMGGEWGGDWKSFKDTPHMQFTNGLTLSNLQAGQKMPDNTLMKWENGGQATVTNVTQTMLTIKQGSRGDEVKELQTQLNKLGFDCGAVDGIFGIKTLAAVKSFQNANALVVDGIVGKNTWAKLKQ